MKALLQTIPAPGMAAKIRAACPPWLELVMVPEQDEAAFLRAVADSDVVLHVLKPITAAMIAAAPRLKLIQKIGVGVNTIDLDAARAAGVRVANMPGSNSRAVAEMTLTLMLAALRRILPLDRATRDGQGWSQEPAFYDRVGEIGGRRVGLIGYGAVPRLLVPVLQALGADVVYTARAPKADAAGLYLPLPELLASADIISLHIPLTDATRNLLDAAAIASLKPGAVLVNTARGELIDEAALATALADGRVAAAGLDVFRQEPVGPDCPLLALPNVVLAPHVAWLTPETMDRSVSIAFENCRRLRDGEPLLHAVV